MKSALLRRLDRVEKSLNPASTRYQAIVIPNDWAADEIDVKLERWKAGEVIGNLLPYNPNVEQLCLIRRKHVSPNRDRPE